MSDKNQKVIRVCIGGTCGSMGAEKVMEALVQAYGIGPGESNEEIDLDYTGCIGNCDFAVTVDVNGCIINNADPKTIVDEIEKKSLNDQVNKEPKTDKIFNENYLGDL